MATKSKTQKDSDYSVRLSLDIRGRDLSTSWPWFVALIAILASSPLVKQLVEKVF
jgi:hypothetical protein